VREDAVIPTKIPRAETADVEVDLGDEVLKSATVESNTVAAVAGEELVCT
jgi:hypothetical protein